MVTKSSRTKAPRRTSPPAPAEPTPAPELHVSIGFTSCGYVHGRHELTKADGLELLRVALCVSDEEPVYSGLEAVADALTAEIGRIGGAATGPLAHAVDRLALSVQRLRVLAELHRRMVAHAEAELAAKGGAS